MTIPAATHFLLEAPGANPAAGEGRKTQDVNVVEATTPRAVVMSCDPAQRTVSGSFGRFASCNAGVSRMSGPEVEITARQKHRVCLLAPEGAKYCADPDGSVAIGRVVDDTWKVEVPLDPGQACDPGKYPALAAMTVEIDCGQVEK